MRGAFLLGLQGKVADEREWLKGPARIDECCSKKARRDRRFVGRRGGPQRLGKRGSVSFKVDLRTSPSFPLASDKPSLVCSWLARSVRGGDVGCHLGDPRDRIREKSRINNVDLV